MANSETFEELEQQLEAVLDSESTDFFDLAAMLDLDPKQDFAGTNLSGTDLSDKDMSHANLSGTNLRGTDLSDVNFEGADFTNADLSSALLLEFNNLETITGLQVLRFAHDIAIQIDWIRKNELTLNSSNSPLIHLLESFITLAQNLSNYEDLGDIDLTLTSLRTFGLTLFAASTLASAVEQNNTDEIVAILNRLQSQYLGATLRGANLTNTTWHGANLTGTLMLNCQGLTSEEIAQLKLKGAIFDTAPNNPFLNQNRTLDLIDRIQQLVAKKDSLNSVGGSSSLASEEASVFGKKEE